MTNTLHQSAATSADVTLGQTMRAHCPSCAQSSIFTFVGIQHWPERVAAAMNVPAQTNLWHCNHCQTTLSGNAFED